MLGFHVVTGSSNKANLTCQVELDICLSLSLWIFVWVPFEWNAAHSVTFACHASCSLTYITVTAVAHPKFSLIFFNNCFVKDSQKDWFLPVTFHFIRWNYNSCSQILSLPCFCFLFLYCNKQLQMSRSLSWHSNCCRKKHNIIRWVFHYDAKPVSFLKGCYMLIE